MCPLCIHNHNHRLKNSFANGLDSLSNGFRLAIGRVLHRTVLLLDDPNGYLKDGLTDAKNRKQFDYDLKESLGRENYYLIKLDINNFKLINDTFGHKVGDDVLTFFADYVRSFIRKKDDFYRLGGDEFALIINSTNPELVINRLQESITLLLRESIKINYEGDGVDYDYLSTGFSYGLVDLSKYSDSSDAYKQADTIERRNKKNQK